MIICSHHTLNARFELGALIGAGNYAQIFRATDVETGETVAIKVLRSEHAQDPTTRSLFEQEAAIGLALEHDNLVRTRLSDQDANSHYIVMDLVPGVSLRRRIHLTGALPVSDAIHILQGVLSGLEAIHAAGYIHRDIKPQNILLEATGIPKIADFGIAIDQGQPGVTVEGIALGTAAYIAPEQAIGQAIGPEADVYAAGAVLFEMLTGQAPFPGDDPLVVMNRHLTEAPPDPRSINPDIAPALATIILRALSKQPEDRFSTAREMRQALTALQPERQPAARRGVATLARGLLGHSASPPRLLTDHGVPTTSAARIFVPALMTTVLFIVLVLALVSSGAMQTSPPQAPSNAAPTAASGSLPPVATAPSTARHHEIPTGWSVEAAVSRPQEAATALEGSHVTGAVSTASQTALTIYDNQLAAGWDTSLSWSASVELSALETPQATIHAISYTPTGAWAGLQLRSDGTVNTAGYQAIQFSVKSTRNGEPLAIYLRDANFVNLSKPLPLDQFGGYPTANGWTTYTIPLADLNASRVTLGSVVIHSWTNRPQPTLYVNNIRLVNTSR